MSKVSALKHEFVGFIPDHLEEEKLYISIEYTTVAHKCCCGCGKEVVTPISPTDWKLIFDGKTISLAPSIGNWGFACKSHYWIQNNRVHWASRWSERQIEHGRGYDRSAKERYFGASEAAPQGAENDCSKQKLPKSRKKLFQGLARWFTRRGS
jgi:hypothetical protein